MVGTAVALGAGLLIICFGAAWLRSPRLRERWTRQLPESQARLVDELHVHVWLGGALLLFGLTNVALAVVTFLLNRR